MEMVVITGMSGAGKSRVIGAMEDIGYYCVDNMPPILLGKFADLAKQSDGAISKIAVVTDSRGGKMFHELICELERLKENGIEYRLLFLDCADNVLMRRYKETRRKHPLSSYENPSIADAIAKEREMLYPARMRADYIIDSTHLSAIQLKERISSIFLDNISNGMLIACMSFGFKFGSPAEADLVFDVRCLPNPFYIKELKTKTGIDQEVRDYVMGFPQSAELLRKLTDLVDFLIPQYITEGKTQLVIAMGCTGGKHRSITFAELMYKHLLDQNRKVIVNHRDVNK